MNKTEEEEQDEFLENKELKVTSLDPNERKLARRLRIERRIEALKKLAMPEGEEEEEVLEKSLFQEQLEKSTQVLEKLTLEGYELVTNVRVASDSRETDRKEDEALNREQILALIEDEGVAAEDKFNEISERWLSVLKHNDPLLINDEIGAQKDKSDELIKQKDEIIANLKNEIKRAELKFAIDQKMQTEDIETLARRIEKQVTLMRRAYNQELQLIEDVIATERSLLIEANNKKWEELYKKRDQEEQANYETKIEQLEEFETLCNNLRLNHQENYRDTKIKLENDIEMLQQELEEVKTFSLTNTEKLDYNYQILKKREDENIIIKSQQKRKMNKVQDAISTTNKKINDYRKFSSDEIDRLTREVRKLQASVLDIEAKADIFAKVNDLKYKELWEFNRKRAAQVLNNILTTDRILYEQQLGLEWTNPQQQLLDKTELPSFISAMEVVQELFKKDAEGANSRKGKTANETSEKCKSLNESEPGENMGHRRLLKIILKMIADKSGFLTEGRLNDILDPYSESEKTLINVDSVFSALGIKRKEDIELLVEYFLPYAHCPVCTGKLPSSIQSSESEIMMVNLNDDVSSDSSSELIQDNQSEDYPSTNEAEFDLLQAVHQPNKLIDEIVSTLIDDGSVKDIDEYDSQANHSEPSHQNEDNSKSKIVTGNSAYELTSINTSKTTTKTVDDDSISKLSCLNNHPLVISSVYILKALKEFVSKFYVPEGGPTTMTSRLAYKRSTVSRLIVGDEVKMFWERFKQIFSDDREALWDGLTIGMQKYHEILKDRKKLNDEVVILRRQNTELKHLLSSYKKDFQKKLKPPCAKQRGILVKPAVINL